MPPTPTAPDPPLVWDEPTLHLHAQYAEHCEAYLVANRQGLEKLRALIDRALTTDAPVVLEQSFFVNDGEGFSLFIIQENGDWRGIMQPYTADWHQERAQWATRYPSHSGLTDSNAPAPAA